MLRRQKRAQLTKNIIAESERIIEFGEHASYSLGSTAGCAFRDRFCREPCEVSNAAARFRISRRCVKLCKLQFERDTIFSLPA